MFTASAAAAVAAVAATAAAATAAAATADRPDLSSSQCQGTLGPRLLFPGPAPATGTSVLRSEAHTTMVNGLRHCPSSCIAFTLAHEPCWLPTGC
jgi:hypothetical protein